jgi:kynurenine/2-aminoadipate aminotransferase
LLILKEWGYEGFDNHVETVTEFYRQKKYMCLKAAEKHLTGLLSLALVYTNLF